MLLEFAENCDGEYAAVYRELLTYDMYLRENLKSRPDFAADMSEESVKNIVRDFYRKEEEERRYLPDYKEYDWKQLSKMTHLEPFVYPVWDREAMLAWRKASHREQTCHQEQISHQEQASPKVYVLFDYRNRDPINQEAYTQVAIR